MDFFQTAFAADNIPVAFDKHKYYVTNNETSSKPSNLKVRERILIYQFSSPQPTYLH